MVEIRFVASRIDHRIDRTRPAQGFAARPIKSALTGCGVTLGVKSPVVFAAVHQEQHVDRVAIIDKVRGTVAAGFDQTN